MWLRTVILLIFSLLSAGAFPSLSTNTKKALVMDSHSTVVTKPDFRLSLPGQWVETTTGIPEEGYQFVNSNSGEYINVTVLEVKSGANLNTLENLTAQIADIRKRAFQKFRNGNVQFSPVQHEESKNVHIAEFAGHDLTNNTLFCQHIRANLNKIVILNIYTSSPHLVSPDFNGRCELISESLELNGI